jgi:TatD DNase family protein
MNLVDTHVHINFDAFQSDLDQVAQRWRSAGLKYLIHSCVQPGEFERTQALADRYPEVFLAVGLHPLEAEQWQDHYPTWMTALATSDSRVVAIGEMGLDFYKSQAVAAQYTALEGQLCIARALNLPVIIHCRDAAQPLAEFLRTFWQHQGPVSGVMHCWGGTVEETQWFLDLGLYVSFSGTVTFKKADTIREAAAIVPSDRLLIETDCPFLAPVPWRGNRNEPAFVRHVAETLAEIRQIDGEALAEQTTANAKTLFRLPDPAPAH